MNSSFHSRSVPGSPKPNPKPLGLVRLAFLPVPANDQIPCFYTGQNADFDRPAKVATRDRCREWKKMNLGGFRDSGRVFFFNQRIETAIVFSAPASAKTILAFLKTRTDGEKLHYWIGPPPHSLRLHGLHHRRDEKGVLQVLGREIPVSSRSKFNDQVVA